MKRFVYLLPLLALAAAVLPGRQSAAPAPTLTVSAAADLMRVFPVIADRFTQETGIRVALNFGATRKLAFEIEQGAPVDVFAAADRASVEDLARKGAIEPGSVRAYAIGRLVLCVPARSKLRLKDVRDLAAPAVERIAIANPDKAPYGRAAREALQSVGVWAKVQSRIVPAENVRQALQYAETNNVSAALVARSLMPGHDVRWVLVPAKLHRPITQTLGVVKAGKQDAAARRFAAYLTGPAQECLRRCGFETPRELRARR